MLMLRHATLLSISRVFVTVLLVSGCTTMTRHYNEIGDPNLPFIAKIRADRGGSSVVIYNSEICREIGDACGFFRSHAYAHLALNHQPFLPPDHYPTAMEDEADCWAAGNADPEEVTAAVELLRNDAAIRDLPITGNPARRADHIEQCASQAGNT